MKILGDQPLDERQEQVGRPLLGGVAHYHVEVAADCNSRIIGRSMTLSGG